MAVATAADVAVPLGRPITAAAEVAQVEWWLTGVERLIISRLGDVHALDEEAVRYVEAEAVAAKARRSGQSETSITTTVDDGSVTRRWDGAGSVAAGDITEEWWDLLTGVDTAGGAKVGWLL
jgi:hypothetical protein